jgi:hypothetical protein
MTQDNVTRLHKDPVPDMIGPKPIGNSVIVEGHIIPNMTMIDRGDIVEFVIDNRMGFEFPRECAYTAACFAATAMAIGAGHPHFKYPHKSNQAYASPCVGIEITDDGIKPA